MKSLIKHTAIGLVLGLSLCSLSSLTLALPADFDAKMAARPADDKARDAARHPKETVELLGIKEGMTVVEVAAGGGWFTRVLSAAVGPKGKVIAQFGAFALRNNNGQAAKDLSAELGNVTPVFEGVDSIAAGSADAALTAQNLHDQYNNNEVAGQKFITDIFNVLKPGAAAVIIDHAGSEGADNKAMHRVTAAATKGLIQKAGFEIVQESKLLANPADDHSKSSHDASLAKATDQFLFVVRKPAKK
ncbi:MAG: methyltransferase [Gammaproteobacteria bacterium]|jgi:hypothetical protein